MIEITIKSNNPNTDELRILSQALTKLSNLNDAPMDAPVVEAGPMDAPVVEAGPIVEEIEITGIPPILQEQNPVETVSEQNLVEPPRNQSDTTPEPEEDTITVDSEGYPWDKRIHASTKTQTQNGVWKLVRKPKVFETDEQWHSFINRVRDELRSKLDNASEPASEINPQEAFAGTVTLEQVTAIPQTPEELAAAAATESAPIPVTEPAPTVPGLAPVNTFPELLKFVTGNQQYFTGNVITEVCNRHGVGTLIDLQKDNSKISVIYNDLLKLINGAQ